MAQKKVSVLQREYVEIMDTHGFERIDGQQGRRAYWREIDSRGRHMLVEAAHGSIFALPDFHTRPAIVSVYRGPDLREKLERQQTVYSITELLAVMNIFIEEYIREARQSQHYGVGR